ncbi:MAG: MerR family transcriptional regulator [Pseudomonadota bacterium]
MAAKKSPDAFRTISEVADWLGVNAHVLRFWETKFSQIKPVKRAGGRRYYRKSDMELLGGIKQLLHEDGLTIKGAQKVLREKGVKTVAALSKPVDDMLEAAAPASQEPAAAAQPEAEPAAAAVQSEPEPTAAAQPVAEHAAAARPEAETVGARDRAASSPEPAISEPAGVEAQADLATPEGAQEDAEIEAEIAEALETAAFVDQALAAPEAQPSLFDSIADKAEDSAPAIAPLPPLTSGPPLAPDPAVEAEQVAEARALDVAPDPAAPTTAEPIPEIAPLETSDISVTEGLAQVAPGQIPAAVLGPLLEQARALRIRMGHGTRP